MDEKQLRAASAGDVVRYLDRTSAIRVGEILASVENMLSRVDALEKRLADFLADMSKREKPVIEIDRGLSFAEGRVNRKIREFRALPTSGLILPAAVHAALKARALSTLGELEDFLERPCAARLDLFNDIGVTYVPYVVYELAKVKCDFMLDPITTEEGGHV